MKSTGWVAAGALVIACALVACSDRGDPDHGSRETLSDQLVGEWETWCRVDSIDRTECLGKEGEPVWTFERGGRAVRRSRHGTYDGTWVLDGYELTIDLKSSQVEVTLFYRARIREGRLILWTEGEDGATVLGRVGTTFLPAPGPTAASTGPTGGEVRGLRYQLTLPPRYRLARNDRIGQRWEPAAGEGLVFLVRVMPRGRITEPSGASVVEPCSGWDLSRGSKLQNDVLVGVDAASCVPDSDLSISCSASHTQGHLDPADEERGHAICATLAIDSAR